MKSKNWKKIALIGIIATITPGGFIALGIYSLKKHLDRRKIKMRIAFDVMGTLNGPKEEILLKLFRELQASGHECVVWSNSYGFALDCVRDNNLNCESMAKLSKLDLFERDQPSFDIAIDDQRNSATYLGAKRFVFVDEIDENTTIYDILGQRPKV